MMKRILLILSLLALAFSSATYAFAETNNYSLETKARKIAAKTANLKPSLVRLAITAYNNARHSGVNTSKHVLTVIDYSLPSTAQRLWVIDLKNEKILHASMVAHGKNSGENYTTKFSNRLGSLQTSLGLFLTEGTYFGRDGYSLYLKGLERGFNDNAKVRTIVMHGAPYVSKRFIAAAGRVGRSWGCPAVEKSLAKPIINTIKGGTLVFAYYPDRNWLYNSAFINDRA